METGLEPVVEAAVNRGIEHYVTMRRAKVPHFVAGHFSFRGALALHRKTLRKDFYKYPLNLLWGPPAAAIRGTAWLLDKAGPKQAAAWLYKLPPGIPTELEKELQWLLYTELLELPYAQGHRVSDRDALLEAILSDPKIAALSDEYLREIERHAGQPEFRAALERNLAEYGKTRLAVSELAGGLLNLASGYVAAHQVTPGALSAGTAAATAIAQQIAIAQFWLGSTIGAWYYAIFPASASAGLIVATTGALLTTVGVLSALAWVVIDPLLAKTGFHQRRLDRFIVALGEELCGSKRGNYRIRDHYIARVLDVLDILRVAARTGS
jgi:hypothetical protein